MDDTDESTESEVKSVSGSGKRRKEFKDSTSRSSKKLIIEDLESGEKEKLFDVCLKDIPTSNNSSNANEDKLKPSWSNASSMMVKESMDVKVTSSSTKAKDDVHKYLKTYNEYVTMANDIRAQNTKEDKGNSEILMSSELELKNDSNLKTPPKESNLKKEKRSSMKTTTGVNVGEEEEESLSDLVFKVENYKNKRG